MTLNEFRSCFVKLLLLSLFSSGCLSNQSPSELVVSRNFALFQTHRAGLGEMVLQESRIKFLPRYAALRDYEIGAPFFYQLKKDMVFEVKRKISRNFVIWNGEFFDSDPSIGLQIKKNGTLASEKPLGPLKRPEKWKWAQQPKWEIAGEKVFRRLYEPGAINYELIFGGTDKDYFYLHYREIIPGSSDTAYQEVLKFRLSAEFIEILGKKLRIISVNRNQLAYVVEHSRRRQDNYNRFANENIAANPSFVPEATYPIQDLPLPDDPKRAFDRLLMLYRENYMGLFYDSFDYYSKEKVKTAIKLVVSAQSRNVSERELFIKSTKAVTEGNLSFPYLAEIQDVTDVRAEDSKAEIHAKLYNGKNVSFYMLKENGVWKFRFA